MVASFQASQIIMSSRRVRVRFAPSPTGMQHVGGMRTALLNYLFARKHGGDFLLRIEDTDQTRLVPEAEAYIVAAMDWLGITPDEGPLQGGPHAPYRQSERKEMYFAYALELVKKGKAYYAFDKPEELEVMREGLKQQGVAAPRYNSVTRAAMQNSLTLPFDEVERRLAAGQPYVIRLLVDPRKQVKLYDEVRGWVKVEGSSLDDKVLLKADGMPTYHLANVVDDHLMEISHVIRGEEWLPSAPIHALLYEAFDWQMPVMAHLPLILRADGQGKLSKRDAQQAGTIIFPLCWEDKETDIVYEGFREGGYLPDALNNVLALLGWHPGGDQEYFSREDLIQRFLLEGINKAGARLDMHKAAYLNQQHLKRLDSQELAERCLLPALSKHGIQADPRQAAAVCKVLRERVYFTHELANEGRAFFVTPDRSAIAPVHEAWDQAGLRFLEECAAWLAEVLPFEEESLEAALKQLLSASGMPARKGMPLLRYALLGNTKGPHISTILMLLGRAGAGARLAEAIALWKPLLQEDR